MTSENTRQTQGVGWMPNGMVIKIFYKYSPYKTYRLNPEALDFRVASGLSSGYLLWEMS
jgi:hypothetical protein